MVDQYFLSLSACSCTCSNLRVFVTFSSGGFVASLLLLRKITSFIFLWVHLMRFRFIFSKL